MNTADDARDVLTALAEVKRLDPDGADLTDEQWDAVIVQTDECMDRAETLARFRLALESDGAVLRAGAAVCGHASPLNQARAVIAAVLAYAEWEATK